MECIDKGDIIGALFLYFRKAFDLVDHKILLNKLLLYNFSNASPDYISNLLKLLSESHSLNLRSSENGTLNIPRARTAFYDNSFTCSAPKLWNALPQTVRDADSLLTFKSIFEVF